MSTANPTDRDVLDLEALDQTQVDLVGGKAANLGELLRIEGIRVPPGFCVTTAAFQRIMSGQPSLGVLLDRLANADPDDQETIQRLSAEIRATIEGIPIPEDLAAAIRRSLGRFSEDAGWAVRSSATAEDLPGASFAGQQDTYLNVIGPDAVIQHVRRCWASLYNDRAVSYRLRNGIDHMAVRMAVVVQQMVFPQAAGVLFTANPVTGNRKVTAVEATVGLGEALLSGLVTPDTYTVRDGTITGRTIAIKQGAIHPSASGGTTAQPIDPGRRTQPALTDEQVIRLEQLGRQIERHFGLPQDIEFCLVDDGSADGAVVIVQSRPITTLFPIPASADDENHVYISVGHQQMMTDPIKPLGLSVWLLTTPAPMVTAAGRLFVDVTSRLASPTARDGFLQMVGKSDPLISDALQTVIDRGFVPLLDEDGPAGPPPALPGAGLPPIATDPAVVADLIADTQASLDTVKRAIRPLSGAALLEFILADFQELRRVLFDPRSHQAIMAGMEATWWLNDHLQDWLGETNAADILTQSVPHNITAEMGLALLDVADAIRPHPQVVAFLRRAEDADFLARLSTLPGGQQARTAIDGYLDTYGMRCVGEIDITRPRWSERPSALVPVILSNVENFEPGEGARRFERGRQDAQQWEGELLERLRALPDGARKAEETKRMIDRVRTFAGYREYPKYGMISRYFVYKQALLEEAERQVQAGVLGEVEDIFFLTLHELHDVARTNAVDGALISQRRDAFRSYRALTPPRVLTSEGEALSGSYRRDDVPDGALVGLPVSAGTVEGRARVILDMADADLEAGDILVTTFTDPSWTPVFVAVAGLVTEVGGAMTHGAVIAREYGLPAVVGVGDATRLIQDGQRIRVHGTDGYVEILPA